MSSASISIWNYTVLEPTPSWYLSTVHYRLPTDTLQISGSGSNNQSKTYWQFWGNRYLSGFHPLLRDAHCHQLMLTK